MSKDKELEGKELENVTGGVQKGTPSAPVMASDRRENTEAIQIAEGEVYHDHKGRSRG